MRLGSFNNDQLRGDNYLLFGGGYLRGVGRMPDVLGGNIFLGAWVEGGSAFDDWDYQDWKSDITGGAILETLLGPVFLGGSVASRAAAASTSRSGRSSSRPDRPSRHEARSSRFP